MGKDAIYAGDYIVGPGPESGVSRVRGPVEGVGLGITAGIMRSAWIAPSVRSHHLGIENVGGAVPCGGIEWGISSDDSVRDTLCGIQGEHVTLAGRRLLSQEVIAAGKGQGSESRYCKKYVFFHIAFVFRKLSQFRRRETW